MPDLIREGSVALKPSGWKSSASVGSLNAEVPTNFSDVIFGCALKSAAKTKMIHKKTTAKGNFILF